MRWSLPRHSPRSPFPALAVLVCTPLAAPPQEAPEFSPQAQVEAHDELGRWARDYLEKLAPSPDGPEEPVSARVTRIGAIYLLSVGSRDWMDRGRDSVKVVISATGLEGEDAVVLRGYEGALEVLRAKHSRWPPNKLRFLGKGSEILDDLVLRHPENLPVRFLRFASYRALPFFLSREEAVRADLDVLSRELPEGSAAFSPEMYRAVVRFVLDNAELTDEEALRLRTTIDG